MATRNTALRPATIPEEEEKILLETTKRLTKWVFTISPLPHILVY
jgi:hypothetical protein